MNLKIVVSILLITLIVSTAYVGDVFRDVRKSSSDIFNDYLNNFVEAVDDTGVFLSRLEAQQAEEGVRYTKEKQLAYERETVNVFFYNLALRFGIQGNEVEELNLRSHVPVMVIMKYDSYSLVYDDPSDNVFKLDIFESRPYYYKLPNNNILYFTMDDNVKVYNWGLNKFFEGTYEEIFETTDISMIQDVSAFRQIRDQVIMQNIEKDIDHVLNSVYGLNRNVLSYLSVDISGNNFLESKISNIGVFAVIQGYPLPGGETLSYASYGSGNVTQRTKYIATIDQSGMHIAYESGCVPQGSYIEIEEIFGAKEAARKGYFVKECRDLN